MKMANSDSTFSPSRSRIEEGNSHKDNLDDRARTVEMLRKLEKMEEKSPNNNNMLVAVDLPMRKSASFQNITEISEDCSVDLQRRGSDSRSMPNSPTGERSERLPGKTAETLGITEVVDPYPWGFGCELNSS
ncbi:hypothetical protein OS493_006593 [Desmophyllum pertusum]|uniref:Uncharacterized protein n=1 Tax=Desmophyllum pertusum TaxID=174260 RepID=A0A9X0A566_9CNID|nr:hypothetical protein OS493_006593 [Desmophyllum pertusum]